MDVGVSSSRAYEHFNYLEAWYPHKTQLTAVGIDDASFLEQLYPGVTFCRSDARAAAHSSAVSEHAGSRADQAQLLAEMWRVCRKGLFVTTPNRWFPVELHSVIPLIHWLPAPVFRRALLTLGHDKLADEANLNLLSRADLLRAAAVAGIHAPRVESARLGGWTSNLLLIARKPAGALLQRS